MEMGKERSKNLFNPVKGIISQLECRLRGLKEERQVGLKGEQEKFSFKIYST